jgi:probable HAF family extracellular repeat protein
MAIGLAAFIAALSANAAQNYTAQPLGTLGGKGSVGYGINNSGQVTGWSWTTGDLVAHPFLYTDGVMTDLGSLGGDVVHGEAVNNLGQVAGWDSKDGLTAHGLLRAFLYSRGSMTDLGALIGPGSFSEAHAINDSGQVVGDAATAGGVNTYAFLYAAGMVTNLGTLGGSQSLGNGINNSGQLTGGSRIVGDVAQHAYVYSAGKMTDLGTLPNGSNSVGYAINNSGQVTGSADTATPPQLQPPVPPPDTLSHAFLYSGAIMSDLGTLGGMHSAGLSINTNGQVVGWSEPANASSVAFIYSDGKMYDLNSLVVSGLAGATLNEARGINDNGQIVANGCMGVICQAFRLDPVLPTSSGGGGCGFISGAPAGPIDPTLPAMLMSVFAWASFPRVRSWITNVRPQRWLRARGAAFHTPTPCHLRNSWH